MKRSKLFAVLLLCAVSFGIIQSAFADENPKAEAYKRQCVSVRYKDVARDPERYEEQDITFTGTARHIEEDGALTAFQLEQDNLDEMFSFDNWVAAYFRKQGESRIINGDRLKVYGKCKGLTSVQNIFGATISVPMIQIRHYERLN